MATPTETLTLPSILSESKRIVNAHSRHFLALSLLFLLPISFFITIYPTLYSSLSHHYPNPINTKTLIRLNLHNPFKPQIAPIIFSIFIAFLSVSAVATITHSTFHGFYGRPVRLGSAIKSLTRSLIPLLLTTVFVMFFVLLIVSFFGFLFWGIIEGVCFLGFYFGELLKVIEGVCFLGFNFKYGSDGYSWLMLLSAVCLGLVLVYLYVHILLCYVVVVVESKWGLEALRRSGSLIKGMRLVSLWLLFFGCITVVLPLWLNSIPLVKFKGGFDLWKSVGFVVQTVLSSSFVTLFMLISISANTVLYMYCKALHGELASEIAEEFAREYFSLPFDNDKVPHIVTVMQG